MQVQELYTASILIEAKGKASNNNVFAQPPYTLRKFAITSYYRLGFACTLIWKIWWRKKVSQSTFLQHSRRHAHEFQFHLFENLHIIKCVIGQRCSRTIVSYYKILLSLDQTSIPYFGLKYLLVEQKRYYCLALCFD